jgi:ElaB/YqjD/DUF883 family membrane-anchored ribosome-binding protein
MVNPTHSTHPNSETATRGHLDKESVRDAVHGAAEAARDAYESAKDRVTELEGSLETAIRKHPIRSILVAGGVGLVIGLILTRRR